MEKSDNANDPEKVAENADVEVAEHLSRIDIEGATSLSGLRAIDDDAADEEELPDSAIEGTLLRLFFFIFSLGRHPQMLSERMFQLESIKPREEFDVEIHQFSGYSYHVCVQLSGIITQEDSTAEHSQFYCTSRPGNISSLSSQSFIPSVPCCPSRTIVQLVGSAID